LNLLKEVPEKGVTSIIISHKLSEIAYVADRVESAIIRDGAVIETIDSSDGKVTSSGLSSEWSRPRADEPFPQAGNGAFRTKSCWRWITGPFSTRSTPTARW
jgi:putative multiple sugar transport system ATP-binding protein